MSEKYPITPAMAANNKVDHLALGDALSTAGYSYNVDDSGDDAVAYLDDNTSDEDAVAAMLIVAEHTGEPLPVNPIVADGAVVELREHDGKLYVMRESGPEEIDASALTPCVI